MQRGRGEGVGLRPDERRVAAEQAENQRAEEDVGRRLDVDPGVHLTPLDRAPPEPGDGLSPAGQEELPEVSGPLGIGHAGRSSCAKITPDGL